MITDYTPLSPWAEGIARQKRYIHSEGEHWGDTAHRVVKNVLKPSGHDMRTSIAKRLERAIADRKFLPGGRYLYAAGRPLHQTQNCLLLSVHDSREGWAELIHKTAMALMTGAGIGVDYSSIRPEGAPIMKTGGEATGPIALMQIVNEQGRGIMQGGSRRSAIWAGLRWDHPDIMRFIAAKNWSDDVKRMKMKDYSFPAFLDMTNISVLLNDSFFFAYYDEDDPKHSLAHSVYWETVRHMLETAEPGFSIDCKDNAGETLRNAPVAGDTWVLTDQGYKQVINIVGKNQRLWTGYQWADATFQCTKRQTPTITVSMSGGRSVTCDPDHEFFVRSYERKGRRRFCQIFQVPAKDLREGDYLDVQLPDNGRNETEIQVLSIEEGPIQDVYCCDVGVPEHSFVADGVRISNCTEVTSSDSDDICNLGSINLGAVKDIYEFRDLVELGTIFLLAGTLYSDLPYYDVDKVRTKNRRLGLGLMGIHEWLLKRGKKYGPDSELETWLQIYRHHSRKVADAEADRLGISRPKKVRAIAPTGTISIVAETSSGIEPLFCAAYKRRYLKGGKYWAYQHVVDPVARRLVDQGVDPDVIEDAYSISENVERRVEFQKWVQQYVDHGISSTINIPHWGSEWNNEDRVKDFGKMLLKYLPDLRGLTVYPDGARGGQPLTPVPFLQAMNDEGIERIESGTDVCDITKGGSCND